MSCRQCAECINFIPTKEGKLMEFKNCKNCKPDGYGRCTKRKEKR